MRLSVAMCTYNGERYLPVQLDSLIRQTRPPDELVVCDDRSSDGTVAVLRKFAKRASFAVRIQENECNVGSTKNFERTIALCQGDVIATCDQDDVWLPHKLATLESTLTDSPTVGFVFSDAVMVDGDLKPFGFRLWQAIRFNRRLRQQVREGMCFEVLLRRYLVTGATLAFRSSFKRLILPIPSCWVHDAWIALLISAVAPAMAVAEPLIEYRQHSAQQIGEKKRGLYGQYLLARNMGRPRFQRDLQAFSAALERLTDAAGGTVRPDRISALQQKVEHCRRRVAMREVSRWRRLPLVVRELWQRRYGRYSLGWKSIAQDLFL